jgi:hypothetical protein
VASKFEKSANKSQTFLNLQALGTVTKNAEFYAAFKTAEKMQNFTQLSTNK